MYTYFEIVHRMTMLNQRQVQIERTKYKTVDRRHVFYVLRSNKSMIAKLSLGKTTEYRTL